MVIPNTAEVSDIQLVPGFWGPPSQPGVALPGGERFYSAGGPGEGSPPAQTQGIGVGGDVTVSAPMYSESFIPRYGPGGVFEGWKPKGAPGAIMEGGAYLDPVSMENYANAARQADIYKKIKTRLDDPSNDLLEELERQWEVEYESKRADLVNKESELLREAKAKGWDERTTGFLRDSLYAKFAEDDMKLKGKYANMQQQWGFVDKEVARRVRIGEVNSQQAEELARNLKMRELNYEFPGTVRGQLDKATALAAADAAIATGVDPREADYRYGVPGWVRNRTGQGTDRDKALRDFNQLRSQGVPLTQAAYRANVDLAKFGVKPEDMQDMDEEEINKIFGPAAANAPAAGVTERGEQGAAGPDAATGLFQMFPGLPPHIQAKIRQAISLGVPMEKLMTSPDLQPYLAGQSNAGNAR